MIWCRAKDANGAKEEINPEVFAKEEEKMKRKKLQRLRNMVASLNYQLVPLP